jgi:hypothetical protein
MKIRVEVSPDSVGQVIEDLGYAGGLAGSKKAEILSPYTMKLLRDIVAAAEEKTASLVREGSEFSDVFAERGEELPAGGTAGLGEAGGVHDGKRE